MKTCHKTCEIVMFNQIINFLSKKHNVGSKFVTSSSALSRNCLALIPAPTRMNKCLCYNSTKKNTATTFEQPFSLCSRPVNKMPVKVWLKCTRGCCKSETWRTIKAPDLFTGTALRLARNQLDQSHSW